MRASTGRMPVCGLIGLFGRIEVDLHVDIHSEALDLSGLLVIRGSHYRVARLAGDIPGCNACRITPGGHAGRLALQACWLSAWQPACSES